ncbi:Uncharacterised protein [Escherichia coli]|nr:Uncharacterised protein [Escherichia coli]
MMCCRMTTCGTFTFEGKSRALPVTVTRCLRNIFRCWSARHWRGSVLCSTVTSGSTAATVSTSAATSATTGAAGEQQLQVQQLQPQQFRQLLQYLAVSSCGSTTGSACSATSWATATSDSVITCGCSVPRQRSLQDASFQPLPVAVRQPERGFYDTGHFFNNWRANNRFDSGGDRTSVTIGCTCTSSCSRCSSTCTSCGRTIG